MPLKIRNEIASDADAIRTVTKCAFSDMPCASGDEHIIVDRLRAADALVISLMATVDDEIVGHIAFSPAACSDGTDPRFTLGPVSVEPKHQRKGIGAALIRRGLQKLRTRQPLRLH